MLSNAVGKQVEFAMRGSYKCFLGSHSLFYVIDESLEDGRHITVHLVGRIADDFPLEAVGVSTDLFNHGLCIVYLH